MNSLLRGLIKVFWVWAGFFLSIWIGWHALAQVDFGYGVLHDKIGIDENIAKYGPKNRYKPLFHKTTKAEREQAFHEIVNAIHQQGIGLKDISYPVNGRPVTLLTEPEVIHLEDVAHLLDLLNKAALPLAAFWLIFTLFFIRTQSVPTLRTSLMTLLFGIGATLLIIAIFGATEVFYQLHVWIFPENNQWFFYYEDSLMSTMMKAPDLFGYIAIMLVTSGLIIFLLSQQISAKLSLKLTKNPSNQ